MSMSKLCLQLLLLVAINIVDAVRLTPDEAEMTLWPASSKGNPTWYATSDFTDKPLTDFNQLAAIANAHWNYVQSKEHARSDGTVLVASLWDPISKTVYSSTVPRGDRKLAMYRNGQKEVPTWWAQAKSVTPTGYYHAEDGCYYMYEQANPGRDHNGKYSTGDFNGGMWLAVYGTFKNKADTEGGIVGLCGANDGKNAVRKPTCMAQANNLGVWYAGRTVPAVQLIPDQEEESMYSDPELEEMIASGCFDVDTETKGLFMRGNKAKKPNTPKKKTTTSKTTTSKTTSSKTTSSKTTTSSSTSKKTTTPSLTSTKTTLSTSTTPKSSLLKAETATTDKPTTTQTSEVSSALSCKMVSSAASATKPVSITLAYLSSFTATKTEAAPTSLSTSST